MDQPVSCGSMLTIDQHAHTHMNMQAAHHIYQRQPSRAKTATIGSLPFHTRRRRWWWGDHQLLSSNHQQWLFCSCRAKLVRSPPSQPQQFRPETEDCTRDPSSAHGGRHENKYVRKVCSRSLDPPPNFLLACAVNRLRFVPGAGNYPPMVFRGWRGSPRRERRGGGPEGAKKGTGVWGEEYVSLFYVGCLRCPPRFLCGVVWLYMYIAALRVRLERVQAGVQSRGSGHDKYGNCWSRAAQRPCMPVFGSPFCLVVASVVVGFCRPAVCDLCADVPCCPWDTVPHFQRAAG